MKLIFEFVDMMTLLVQIIFGAIITIGVYQCCGLTPAIIEGVVYILFDFMIFVRLKTIKE